MNTKNVVDPWFLFTLFFFFFCCWIGSSRGSSFAMDRSIERLNCRSRSRFYGRRCLFVFSLCGSQNGGPYNCTPRFVVVGLSRAYRVKDLLQPSKAQRAWTPTQANKEYRPAWEALVLPSPARTIDQDSKLQPAPSNGPNGPTALIQ